MFFEMRFDLGTLDAGERSLPFGLLVIINLFFIDFTGSTFFQSVIRTGNELNFGILYSREI